jgi:hypothetical protein
MHVVKTYRMKPEEVDKLKDALEKGGRKRTRAASTAKV